MVAAPLEFFARTIYDQIQKSFAPVKVGKAFSERGQIFPDLGELLYRSDFDCLCNSQA